MALWLENSLQAFNIMLQIGAGTGLLFLLRWFWWRINAFSELTAMIVSLLVALYFQFAHKHLFPNVPLAASWKLVLGVGLTTVAWVIATFLTRPTREARLRAFYRLALPGGPGWRRTVERARAAGEPVDDGEGKWTVPLGLLCMMVGCAAVYGALFATGFFLYGNLVPGVILSVVTVASAVFLFRTWRKVSAH